MSASTGPDAAARLAVDTAGVLAAGQALAAVARGCFDARRAAARATAGAGWAQDGALPDALGRFADVLDVSLARLVDDAREAAALLALAGAAYAAAERSADAGSVGRTTPGGASRDAPTASGG